MSIKNCEICEKPFKGRKDSVVCSNEKCRKERDNRKARERYAKTLIEKTCPVCKKLFLGKGKQLNCDNCKKKRTPVFKETFKQEIRCRSCDKLLETHTKNKTNKSALILYSKTCDDCKEILNEKQSQYMKLNNPSYSNNLSEDEYLLKQKELEDYNSVENINYRREQSREKASERMKIDNPMFNSESVDKMKKTLNDRIKSKDIIYPQGKNHPLYKGNRNFNKQVRIYLRKWIINQMSLVNFTCQKCNKNNCELQVHHIEPLRDIINDHLIKHEIKIDDLELGSDKCIEIIEDIVKYHNDNNVGLVVCSKCHSNIDKHYKLRKK